MRLLFTKAGTKTRVDIRDDRDNLVKRTVSRFLKPADFELASTELVVDLQFLRMCVDQYERKGTESFVVESSPRVVYVRPMLASSGESFRGATMVDALRTALSVTDIEEPIIYWENFDELAAVDLDCAEGYEFNETKLLGLEGIPIPVVSWVTKTGGLRLIYTNQDPFTAEEIAAVTYLCLMQTVPHQGIEIKRETRHPGGANSNCGTVLWRAQKFDPAYLRKWLRMYSATDDEAQAWLTEHGLEMGQRYDHNLCPLDPGRESHGKPVMVLDKGIYCFSCEAHGVSAGSTRPGFFPFTYLCGTSSSSVVYRCMEAAVHWEQAKYVLECKLGVTGRHAALIYSAGMILHEWPRETIRKSMNAGRNLIRMNDRWTNLNGETYTKDLKPLLATLPTCQTDKGADRAKITIFEQTFDLAGYGYANISPVYGLRIWGHHLAAAERDITAVIQTRDLSDESMVRYRPSYRSIERRMQIDLAWHYVETVFPGVSRNYIRLLIAARGTIEGNSSMTPMIFVTGPTGSGKSISVFLASAICGDINTEVVWTSNAERLRQSIMDARGSFVTFNEPNKEAKRQIKDETSALDFILNLSPDSVSHYMYTGPVRMGRLPAIVLTDTSLGTRVKQDAQLARRITHVRIGGSIDWEQSLKDSGIGHPKDFRRFSEQHAEACNSIVSEVIDEFFQTPSTFDEVARRLGYNRLSHSAEALESRAALIHFFRMTCKAQETNGDTRLKGSGWRLIRRDLETELRLAWLDVYDGEESFGTSRRCDEQDWARLIGASTEVTFESRLIAPDRIYVRFRSGDKVNGEIVP